MRSRSAETGQGLPVPVVLHVAHSVLQALSYAHTLADEGGAPLGLVHRDVSANNVLVSVRGDVKLLDFGIVKAAGRRHETQAGMVKGNVNCMSPEQARGTRVDARSDLFSLAMTLFRSATGEALYGEGGTYELLVRAANGPTEMDIARVRALPGGLGPVLERALSIEPEKRFPSAAEFAAALPPDPADAAAETARLMERHFGELLAAEVGRLNSTNPILAATPAAAPAT
ncbi:MAG: serine/threonine-protein kinase [Myxococcales bacterium]